MRPLFVGLLACLLIGCASVPDRSPIQYSYTIWLCESDQEVAFGPSQEVYEDPATGDELIVTRVPVACADT